MPTQKDLEYLQKNPYEQGTTFEEIMGYDSDIYNLYINLNTKKCYYKQTYVYLPESEFNYLVTVMQNSKKNLWTNSQEWSDEENKEYCTPSQLKKRINKKFQKKFSNQNLEIIINYRGYGNKINDDIGLYAVLKE